MWNATFPHADQTCAGASRKPSPAIARNKVFCSLADTYSNSHGVSSSRLRLPPIRLKTTRPRDTGPETGTADRRTLPLSLRLEYWPVAAQKHRATASRVLATDSLPTTQVRGLSMSTKGPELRHKR